MSDISVLADLEKFLIELPAAIDSRRLGDSLVKAKTKLRDSGRLIERIVALLQLKNEIDFGDITAQAEMVEEVREAAFHTGSHLVNAETAEDLDNAILLLYERELTTSVAQLERAMAQHWRSLVNQQFVPMISIGALLDRINPGSDLGRQLAACGEKARSTQDTVAAPSLLNSARDLLGDRERIQARRREELGDGDIAHFVNALADGDATLAMVTPAVISWLTENDALERLKIVPRT